MASSPQPSSAPVILGPSMEDLFDVPDFSENVIPLFKQYETLKKSIIMSSLSSTSMARPLHHNPSSDPADAASSPPLSSSPAAAFLKQVSLILYQAVGDAYSLLTNETSFFDAGNTTKLLQLESCRDKAPSDGGRSSKSKQVTKAKGKRKVKVEAKNEEGSDNDKENKEKGRGVCDKKKERGKFKPGQAEKYGANVLESLYEWILENLDNTSPCPDLAMRKKLVQASGLETESQIKNWFYNFKKRHQVPLTTQGAEPTSFIDFIICFHERLNPFLKKTRGGGKKGGKAKATKTGAGVKKGGGGRGGGKGGSSKKGKIKKQREYEDSSDEEDDEEDEISIESNDYDEDEEDAGGAFVVNKKAKYAAASCRSEMKETETAAAAVASLRWPSRRRMAPKPYQGILTASTEEYERALHGLENDRENSPFTPSPPHASPSPSPSPSIASPPPLISTSSPPPTTMTMGEGGDSSSANHIMKPFSATKAGGGLEGGGDPSVTKMMKTGSEIPLFDGVEEGEEEEIDEVAIFHLANMQST